jgi:hypothetical protein
MKIRDEKLQQKASVPKKLEDSWEPIIDMHVSGFGCHALCDLGASISIMPRKEAWGELISDLVRRG